MPRPNGLLLILLLCLTMAGRAQSPLPPLPSIQTHRRTNIAYLDSLAWLAKKRYAALTALPAPRTAPVDTLRLKSLYFLGQLYRFYPGRRDSTLYFSQELVDQARQAQNLFYELNGMLDMATYYQSNDRDTPLSLRLSLAIRARIPSQAAYQGVRFQTHRNLGKLYMLAKDYTSALHHMALARAVFGEDSYAQSPREQSRLIDLEQHMGAIYVQQGNFPESERHYRAAESMLTPRQSVPEHAYVYDDLAELYMKWQRYEQALPYAKKAEAIWEQVKPATESKGWGTLACIYAGLKQDNLAYRYAQAVLTLPRPSKFVREQAYLALCQVYERRNDWQNSAAFYKKYVAMRDTIAYDQHTLDLAAIHKQAEFDAIARENRQARQLQLQRLLTVKKQAELNQLRANLQAADLTKKAQLSEQQRRFDHERNQGLLTRQRIAQTIQRQAMEQQMLQQKNDTQRNQLIFLTVCFLFILSILVLLLYMAQLHRKQTEVNLRLTLERKEANARIIQTQETERQRIAADLHDDLGGTLATLRRRLTDIRQRTTDLTLQQAFADAEPLIQKSSDDLRRISHNLMPPEFERIGLCHAVEYLVSSQPASPTRFSFIASGNVQKLPTETELNAYRIVSELVHNINKHAQARQAAIQLLYQADRLTITVDDDGLGNRTAPPNESAGIGLKSSSLRAEYIGATLWREASEAGTLVVLDIPYPTPMYAARTSVPNSLN